MSAWEAWEIGEERNVKALVGLTAELGPTPLPPFTSLSTPSHALGSRQIALPTPRLRAMYLLASDPLLSLFPALKCLFPNLPLVQDPDLVPSVLRSLSGWPWLASLSFLLLCFYHFMCQSSYVCMCH